MRSESYRPMPVAVAHPDQILESLAPVLERVGQRLAAGAPLREGLCETALTGFLVGQGLPPAMAADLVQRWQATGVSQQLAQGPGMEMARPSRRQELISAVRRDMSDEASAAVFYTALMAQTEDPAIREYIRHARDDEQKHYRMLAELHQAIAGQTYEAAPKPVAFTSLADGLKKAMDNEYEAFEEYRQIYLTQQNQQIRNLYFELMTDELEHVTRFNYALQVVG